MDRVLAILLGLAFLSGQVAAQYRKDEDPPFAEPKKDWKWDEDKRFDFLMERLASLEASLDAVNAAIAKASGKKGAKQGEARRAEAGNSAMDRKGGGPMRWTEFYGTTAEKFFYHPVDPNTTYHTNTVLSQAGTRQEDRAGESVQGNPGVPVHQRPPQFDYIYRANRDAKERAEADAAAIQGKIDTLNERREKLEAEQAELWGRLAFRAIQRLDIPRRPELRFHLVASSTEPDDQSRVAVLEAAARFLATSLLIIGKAEKEQAVALGNIKVVVTNARDEFADVILNEPAVAEDSEDKSALLGQFVALAQLLEDTANNLSESYEVATEGGLANDRARKERFRGLLQRSLIEYSQIVMALDEVLPLLRRQWGMDVDKRSKLPTLEVDWGSPMMAMGESREIDVDVPETPKGEAQPPRSRTPLESQRSPSSGKAPLKASRRGKSIQPVPEPKGLAQGIADRLPTRDEIDVIRNAVNLPSNRVREAKSQYMKRIYAAYDAEKWSFTDVTYLMALHASLSNITSETSLELPGGTSFGDGEGRSLARHWVLKSRNERAFVERRNMLDMKTREWFDRAASDHEIKQWLLQLERPVPETAEKAMVLDALMRAGVATQAVGKLRRAMQAAIELGE